jgi:hypothetical protein
MSEELKQRIRAHGRRHAGDRSFAERLLDSAELIESEFAGRERKQLLELVNETFERHLALRDHTRKARENLTALRSHQRRLRELALLMRTRADDETLH